MDFLIEVQVGRSSGFSAQQEVMKGTTSGLVSLSTSGSLGLNGGSSPFVTFSTTSADTEMGF